MGINRGPGVVNDGLVFGYDTGYPISDNAVTYRFNKGEPTETFNIGTMVPTDASASFTSGSTYQSNLAGSAWDWSYYPNSNVSSAGGMEWHPNAKGPGFKGAWLMKKRPGGNGESNFSGTAPGAITSSEAYTVSVWVKTTQANCFRIHLNTTKNGSSYWGYASSRHTGGGEWERLSVTLPAGSGNTSINTIRFQALGTTVTADAYCRDYQVEKNTHATPFLLSGTRSGTASLIDLKKTVSLDVSNVSFNSDAQITFDGTDDEIELPNDLGYSANSVSVFAWFKINGNSPAGGYHIICGTSQLEMSIHSSATYLRNGVSGSSGRFVSNDGNQTLNDGKYHYYGFTFDGSTKRAYIDGVQVGTQSVTGTLTTSFSGRRVGNYADSYYAHGDIPVYKVYDKVLTAVEVQQNYQAYKNRFNT